MSLLVGVFTKTFSLLSVTRFYGFNSTHIHNLERFFVKLPPYSMTGFDLTTHGFAGVPLDHSAAPGHHSKLVS
jgi:hypothetical protein